MTTVTIRAADRSYRALLGPKLLGEIGGLAKERFEMGRCAIISDENVASHFADRVTQSLTSADFESTLITVAGGEKSKSLEQAGAICDQMIAAGLDRSSFVVALGGGVIGDLAGFVAAIFHRGIPWINVPTTLLAQVDSCIGGKTGVNTPAGKNLIGAMHQPAMVIADIETLETLPAREFNQGFAEVIKHAIIRDAALFKEVTQASSLRSTTNASWKLALPDLVSLVRRNLEIKAEFVAADERDASGDRALLNFGHTVGHAIEHAADYRDLLHGEAVSLGIVAACEVSVRKAGLPEAQRAAIVSTLQAFDLPTKLPANFSREKIMEALPRDKKFEGGRVRFVVTPAIGSAHVATDVTLDDIGEAAAKL